MIIPTMIREYAHQHKSGEDPYLRSDFAETLFWHPALVMPDKALSENLLGLAYLTKLKRFEYAGGKLVLEN